MQEDSFLNIPFDKNKLKSKIEMDTWKVKVFFSQLSVVQFFVLFFVV